MILVVRTFFSRLTACGSAASASESAEAAGPATAYRTPAATRGAGAPRSRPSVLRSSSTSGQWIPYPAPTICQFFRCSGVASRSLGYHTRGTVIVRPSARSTLSVSSKKWTSRTASPGLGSEVVIPCLQERSSILENEPLNCSQLTRAETEIPREGHRLEPEFGRSLVSVNVDVSRFTKIMTHEVYSVGAAEKNRRHLNSLTEGGAEWLAAQRRRRRRRRRPLPPQVRRLQMIRLFSGEPRLRDEKPNDP